MMGIFDAIKKMFVTPASSAATSLPSDLKPEEKVLLSRISAINRRNGELSPELYNQMREFESQWLDRNFDFNSVDGINSIPLKKGLRCPHTSGVTGKVYYYLRKKAYAHEDDGNIELALACMKKSVALLNYEEYFSPDEYYPLVKMLARNGYIDEAHKEKAVIDACIANLHTNNRNSSLYQAINDATYFKTDLVKMDVRGAVCSECAKYQGRVYSISGKSRKFPKIPDFFFTSRGVHEGCAPTFWSYIDGVNDPDLEYTLSVHPLKDKRYGRDIVTFSNRPFVDDRTDECKREAEAIRQKEAEKLARQKYHEDNMIEIEYQKFLDRCTVKWLQENFPGKAPKNVTGFRRMRTQNTKNYQALKQLAAEKGKEI